MQKAAKYDNPAWVLLPGHRFFAGKNPDMSKFPKLFSNDNANTTAWGTIGAATSTAALAAILTSISNKISKKEINELRERLRKNKIKSLSVTSIPRESYDETLTKEASIGFEATTIPIGAAIAAGALTHHVVGKKQEKQFREELDAEIVKQRAKLESLYARMLNLYSSGDNFELSKKASADDNPTVLSRSANLLALGLASLAIAPAIAAYSYTKKHSDERAKEKILKDQIIPANLTNIPDTILLQLDPHIKSRKA